VRAWSQANQLREYLVAMGERVGTLDSAEERDAAHAWMSWASDHLAKLDPLQRPLAMPSDPEATTENIRPFLNWSGFWGDLP